MEPLTENSTQYTRYKSLASRAEPLTGLAKDEILQVLEFKTGFARGGWVKLTSVDELRNREYCNLRIISAPLDIPSQEHGSNHLELFKLYQFPVGFLTERLQSVGHSFGSCTRATGQCKLKKASILLYSSNTSTLTRMGGTIELCWKDSHLFKDAWFHFLCKNITLDANGQLTIRNPNIRPDANQLSQADFSWFRSGFLLHSQSRQGSQEREVTLICFGAQSWIKGRFNADFQLEKVMHDPLVLFHMIFEGLYLQLDSATWSLNSVFGHMETNVLRHAALGSIAGRMDFAGLHNVYKHITHLREGADAALHTLQRLIQHVDRSIKKSTSATIGQQTLDSLEHCQTLFHSTKLRLASLDSRIANVINLSFHLVTQQDSKSMKTIAFLTLIFLPASTVASIFGSQFFNLSVDQDGVPHFIFSHWVWMMWVIIVPVTAILVAIWRWPEVMATDPKQETRGSWRALLHWC